LSKRIDNIIAALFLQYNNFPDANILNFIDFVEVNGEQVCSVGHYTAFSKFASHGFSRAQTDRLLLRAGGVWARENRVAYTQRIGNYCLAPDVTRRAKSSILIRFAM